MDQKDLRQWEARCIQEEQPRCQAACPLHVDVRALCGHLAEGKADRAWSVLAKTMPLPAILARICDAPCQKACLRAEIDGPGGGLRIHALERFCAEQTVQPARILPLPSKNKSAAVLGAGLAGLSAAWELARKGFSVTLYGPRVQGLLAGLDEATLPADVLDRELERLARLGAARSKDAMSAKDALDSHDVVFADPEAVQNNDFGPADPLSLGTQWPGLFSGDPRVVDLASPVALASLGRRAANSMERFVQGASLTSGREKEGPFETRLFTSIQGVEPSPPVIGPGDESVSEDQARAEAARCLDCQCLECVKNCVFLEHYKSYPKVYARRIYNNASIVMGTRQANQMINSCMLCGLCETLCPEDFSMADLCLSARQDMVARGKMPPSAHEFALRDMGHANSPQAALARPAPGASTCATAFFPGCQWSASDPDGVARAYGLLRQTDPDMGLLLRCCNVPARWSGREDLFQENLQALRGEWEKLGSPRLVAACPTCLRTLREELPEAEAVPIWDLLGQAGLSTKAKAGALALHDPCTARLDQPLQDQVRGLLTKLGVEFTEPALTREFTECCGFGGLLAEANPELGLEAAAHLARGSDKDFVTYCAMCRDMLARAGKRALHVLDLLNPLEEAGDDPAARPAPGYSERRENRARLKERLLAELWSQAGEEPRDFEQVAVRMAPDTAQRLDQRRILVSDLQKVLLATRTSGRYLASGQTGHRLASLRPWNVTYWVEYQEDKDGFLVHNAWSHRMEILGKSHGKEQMRVAEAEAGGWKCGACDEPLRPAPVDLNYLGSRFTVELPACPRCGQVLIPEPLALGKMAEVEKLLEDK